MPDPTTEDEHGVAGVQEVTASVRVYYTVTDIKFSPVEYVVAYNTTDLI